MLVKLKNFNWNKWLKLILMYNGFASFVGAVMYVEGLHYHLIAYQSWGLVLWSFGALIIQTYLMFYGIFNADKIVTYIKVGFMSIIARFQPQEKL